jgi:predicted  nucleic acid-binding Zn-ribbon protein
MTVAIITLALCVACLGVGCGLTFRWGTKAKDGEVTARKDATAEHDRAEAVTHERDLAMERAAKLAAEVADLGQRLADVEHQRDDLAQKLAKFVVASIANKPASDEGAAIVNDMFSQPLLPKEPK